jgi:membrane protease YdiL (CAAX protease family)
VVRSPFALAVLAVAVAALVLSARERRRYSRWMLWAFVADAFRWSRRLAIPCGLALVAGCLGGAVPAAFYTAAGWVSWSEPSLWSGSVAWLAALTVTAKVALAAVEELVFRGALLEQLLRRTTFGSAVMLVSALYALAHLDRPDGASLVSAAVFLIDGIGFAVAALATGSLWVPTCWHAAKDLTRWLLDSDRTLQWTDGLLRATPIRQAPWVGSASTAGLVDLAVSFAIVTAATRLAMRHVQPAAGADRS